MVRKQRKMLKWEKEYRWKAIMKQSDDRKKEKAQTDGAHLHSQKGEAEPAVAFSTKQQIDNLHKDCTEQQHSPQSPSQNHQSGKNSRHHSSLQHQSSNIEELLKDSRKVFAREQEIREIYKFLSSPNLQILYVCGMPGTGKTLCVNHTINQYTSHSKSTFEAKYINCMKISIHQLQLQIALTAPTVVVFDEYDLLENGEKLILSLLHKKPTQNENNFLLKIITICNNNELPTIQTVLRSFSITTCFFTPYSCEDLCTIVMGKLKNNYLAASEKDLERLVRKGMRNGGGDYREVQKEVIQYFSSNQKGEPKFSQNDSLQKQHPSPSISLIHKHTHVRQLPFKLATLILHSSLHLNRLFYFLVTRILQYSPQSIKCKCEPLTLQSLKSTDIVVQVGLTLLECEYWIREWQSMGVISLKMKKRRLCLLHGKGREAMETAISFDFDLNDVVEELKEFLQRVE